MTKQGIVRQEKQKTLNIVRQTGQQINSLIFNKSGPDLTKLDNLE